MWNGALQFGIMVHIFWTLAISHFSGCVASGPDLSGRRKVPWVQNNGKIKSSKHPLSIDKIINAAYTAGSSMKIFTYV